ncbi:tRNA glutamyl-Q(34) synthetase GluQRS [Litorimonas sp. RW-G-Af-16]|uniref:tRNA glutamyl-Q(34) synthetase GluQRS n=1 Tax=Litorimonas sp. RW-G-Af-16 TaxID=3241168 RepID=UPI003AAE46A0
MLTRFAPSPTGFLHLGHAFAARQAFSFAANNGGQCLLRIEDIDHTRCKIEYRTAIYEDLRWLGFQWPEPVRVQSDHLVDYATSVATLIERGLAYPCGLSRAELATGQRSTQDQSISTDKFLDYFTTPSSASKLSLPFAVRLNLSAALTYVSDYSLLYKATTPAKADALIEQDARPSLERWTNGNHPDPIIARKDIGTSYHIAVTHDDALQGVTYIIRGADFIDQTPLQVLIQRLMDWPTPVYHHHPLLMRHDGEKLSKRTHDTTLRSLREKGLTPEDIFAMATP